MQKNILKNSYVLDYLRAKLHASDNSFIVLACDIESHQLIVMNALIRYWSSVTDFCFYTSF